MYWAVRALSAIIDFKTGVFQLENFMESWWQKEESIPFGFTQAKEFSAKVSFEMQWIFKKLYSKIPQYERLNLKKTSL